LHRDAQQAALSSGLGPHGFARENDIRALIPREHVGHAATHVFREDSSMNCSGPICRPGTRVVNLPNETPQQTFNRERKEQLMLSRRGTEWIHPLGKLC
jgi:hypothetical protein